MTYIYEIDMTTAECFRQHYHPDCDDSAHWEGELPERHWLLDSVYGRNMLKAQVRLAEPGLFVPAWREAPDLDDKLEAMIEVMGLRNWPKPQTMRDKLRYVRFAILAEAALVGGGALPTAPFNLGQKSE